jgi:Xaa-Pro aminopeptidase
LRPGDLLLVDAGAESPEGYASDITRIFPIGGFSPEQQEVHAIVLAAQEAAISAIRPGLPYRDIHLLAARVRVAGLKDMGLMAGDADSAVEAGAHALFFPHGLGHMLGLDVHDMEALGEDHVGYDAAFPRSAQFGLSALRLAKPLAAGNAITVEPGIYFIPALIDAWRSEGRLAEFLRYEAIDRFRGFGGIRIEDDVLVAEDGAQVLSAAIPKTAGDAERTAGG